jgi:hypothetical protein
MKLCKVQSGGVDFIISQWQQVYPGPRFFQAQSVPFAGSVSISRPFAENELREWLRSSAGRNVAEANSIIATLVN